jgi:hypothetical protein
MKAYWGFLLSALQGMLGKELGQLVAWTFCAVIILVIVVPVYMIMKESTKLRSGREDDLDAISGEDSAVNRRTRFGLRVSLNPSVKIGRNVPVGEPFTVKVSGGEPLVLKLDNDAIQKVRDLLSAGNDLDRVCREIEPAYANWGFVQQCAFKKAMELLLEVQQSAGISLTVKRTP